jgi:hypothetical protein
MTPQQMLREGRGVSEGEFVRWEDVPPMAQQPRGTVIYGLVDPRDETVRYVGVTRWYSMAQRLERHLREPTNMNTAGWFVRLKSLGCKPSIRPIAVVEDGRWQQAELYWIAWFRARGRLHNVDGGGLFRNKAGKVKRSMEKAAYHAMRIVQRERATGKTIGPAFGVRPPVNAPWIKPFKKPKVAKTPAEVAAEKLAARAAQLSARQMARIKPLGPSNDTTKASTQPREKAPVSKFWDRVWKATHGKFKPPIS